jgi:hypothetical protein
MSLTNLFYMKMLKFGAEGSKKLLASIFVAILAGKTEAELMSTHGQWSYKIFEPYIREHGLAKFAAVAVDAEVPIFITQTGKEKLLEAFIAKVTNQKCFYMADVDEFIGLTTLNKSKLVPLGEIWFEPINDPALLATPIAAPTPAAPTAPTAAAPPPPTPAIVPAPAPTATTPPATTTLASDAEIASELRAELEEKIAEHRIAEVNFRNGALAMRTANEPATEQLMIEKAEAALAARTKLEAELAELVAGNTSTTPVVRFPNMIQWIEAFKLKDLTFAQFATGDFSGFPSEAGLDRIAEEIDEAMSFVPVK